MFLQNGWYWWSRSVVPVRFQGLWLSFHVETNKTVVLNPGYGAYLCPRKNRWVRGKAVDSLVEIPIDSISSNIESKSLGVLFFADCLVLTATMIINPVPVALIKCLLWTKCWNKHYPHTHDFTLLWAETAFDSVDRTALWCSLYWSMYRRMLFLVSNRCMQTADSLFVIIAFFIAVHCRMVHQN